MGTMARHRDGNKIRRVFNMAIAVGLWGKRENGDFILGPVQAKRWAFKL